MYYLWHPRIILKYWMPRSIKNNEVFEPRRFMVGLIHWNAIQPTLGVKAALRVLKRMMIRIKTPRQESCQRAVSKIAKGDFGTLHRNPDAVITCNFACSCKRWAATAHSDFYTGPERISTSKQPYINLFLRALDKNWVRLAWMKIVYSVESQWEIFYE